MSPASQDAWLGFAWRPRNRERSGMVVLGAAVAALSACSTPEAEPGTLTLIPAERFAAFEVPLSSSIRIALVDSTTACVVDSYEVRVVCMHSDGSTVGAFGGEGEGPGEFGGALSLTRGPGGTVGVSDGGQRRLTVFEPTGAIVSSSIAPFLFVPMAPIGRTAVGSYTVRAASGEHVIELEIESGEILWERVLPHPSELGVAMDCERGLSDGAATPEGRWAFGSCASTMVLWDNEDVTTFHDPTYVPELPSEAEIERYRARRLFGATPPEAQVLQFAETPKRGRIPGRSLIYDDWGRLWVATQRDRAAFSYFSIFSDTTYVGSVQVRDRVEGYDLLGNTLVVLVERLPEDPAGLPGRGVDWYRFEAPNRQ
ncbi:MAG: hypothetical protein OXF01_02010 [Gemmatimonadetes bacterium]|nr:hypothetical protein [Gemmatimonadota bacterium]